MIRRPPAPAEVPGAPRTATSVRPIVVGFAAGHNPLLLNLDDCKADVWAAMATGSGFGEAIGRCAWPTQVAVAAAQP